MAKVTIRLEEAMAVQLKVMAAQRQTTVQAILAGLIERELKLAFAGMR